MKMKFKVCSILGLMTFGFIPILAISSCGDQTLTITPPSPWILSSAEKAKLDEINSGSTTEADKQKIVKAYLSAPILINSTTPVDALISQLNTKENVAKFISESYFNTNVPSAPGTTLYDFLIANFQNLTLTQKTTAGVTTTNLKDLEKFSETTPSIFVISGNSPSPTNNGLNFALRTNLVGNITFEYTEPNYLYISFDTKGTSNNLFDLTMALNNVAVAPSVSNGQLQFTSEFFPSFHEWFRTHYLKV